MPRVCFRLQVDPARLEEYRLRHASVWPEMRAALAETGWRNYSLFLADDGQLIGYLECDDFAAARRRWLPPTSTPGGSRRWPASSSTSGRTVRTRASGR